MDRDELTFLPHSFDPEPTTTGKHENLKLGSCKVWSSR
jgi:hypothetical protein